MRSKIGTKSRLAAHIIALVLLIIMLINVPGLERVSTQLENQTPRKTGSRILDRTAPIMPISVSDSSATLDRVHIAADAAGTPAEGLRPPDASSASGEETPRDSGESTTPAVIEEPPAATESPEDASGTPQSLPELTEMTDSAAVAGEDGPELLAEPEDAGEGAGDEPGAAPTPLGEEGGIEADVPDESAEEGTSIQPDALDGGTDDGEKSVASQPDESGYIVVADSDVEGKPAEPIANANLEVLGDKVYWLGPRHDLERELATIPEIGSLIVIAPLPGYRMHGFEDIRTEIIPADLADLDQEAAEHFVYRTSNVTRPVVVAVRPGALGAAFFKGAYILANRNLSTEDMLREIGPELEDAGAAGDDIVHRLRRLKD